MQKWTPIARAAAARLLSFRKMSPEQALAFSKQKILRFWELTGQRGWARLNPDNSSSYRHTAWDSAWAIKKHAK
jgi:hypothetical protein